MRAAYTKRSWEMSAQRDIGLLVLVLSLDVKFVNIYLKNEDFHTHYMICP